jgi:ABC-type oligopeptide transport system substrate-binding subunit
MNRSKLLAVSAACSALLALGACGPQASSTAEQPAPVAEVVAPSSTIVDAAIASPDHTTLVAAV